MNCLIVDDDEMIRIDLEKKIREIPFLRLAGSCSSALDAAEIISKENIDLVFLDILMPGMTGMQLLETMTAHHPQIILVTSEKKYAVDAFDHQVTDFLVKPFSRERFLKAVMRAISLHNAPESVSLKSKHLFVKVNGCLNKIETSEILYVEALADYVTIHTPTQRYTVHSTMKTILETLPAAEFFRVHNSFIINLEKITRIEDNMVVIDKKLIPVSRSHVKPLLHKVNMLH
ncbi:MAG: response regulator transcription factor [Bacteroidetes bacterium]|nr:response regulator transcription factor [Bacteroidota bacterium]